MDIADKLAVIGNMKKQAATAYKTYKGCKEAEERLKGELMEQLKAADMRSVKGKKYSASIAEKLDVSVTHEQSVLDWLLNTPDVEADVYIGLKKTEFKTLARQMLKDTGELVPGTETVKSEVLTVKENK